MLRAFAEWPTQGAEKEMRLGGAQLPACKRPILLCEVSGENAKRVSELPGRLAHRNFDGQAPAGYRKALESATWNTVAIPYPMASGDPK